MGHVMMEKKKLIIDTKDLNHYFVSLLEGKVVHLIDHLNDLVIDYGKDVSIEISSEEPYEMNAKIYWKRSETDTEFNKRIEKKNRQKLSNVKSRKKRIEKKEAAERLELKRLQKKYT